MSRAGSQKPPKQKPEQQSALLAQVAPTAVQLGGTASQRPAMQVLLQQPALAVQVPPVGVQGVLQTCAVASQVPRQHSAVEVQAAPSARQVSAPKPQRGGSTLSSQRSLQQPRPEPELHVSPVGRQLRFGRSTWHSPPWQTFEQHSALAAQRSLSTLHSPPPQRPPKHPSEQQSSAVWQAAPSAKHAAVQRTTPAIPVTGSQRPLQHAADAAQSVPAA